MTRKASRPKASPLTTLPPEGSPGDWYARGYEAGLVDGCAQAIREVQELAHRVRQTAETVALAAQAAEATDRDTVVLERGLQARYGEASRNPDRWQDSPAYELGVRDYGRRYGRAAKKDAAEAGPTLTPGDPISPAGPEGTPEAEMHRDAGRAWRS